MAWYRAMCCAAVLMSPVMAQSPAAVPELMVRWSDAAARPVAQLDSLHAASGLQSAERLLPATRRGVGRRAGRRAGAEAMERWTRLRFDGSVDTAELLRRYGALPAIELLQPNFLRQHGSYRTDDPRLDEQWNLEAVGWRQRDPGTASGVLVAIIDSGVDAEHPDLAAQIWHNVAEQTGVAGVDDDGNGYVDDVAGWDFADAPGLPGDGDFLDPDPDPDDESGHGTHVAGIVAATSNNGTGIAGVAPGAALMVLRAGFNIGGSGYLQDDDIAAAIVYAADNGAKIINLSLGDPRYSPLLADAVRYATNRDVVVVAAAGNEGSSEVYYPARLDETIGVAAAGRAGHPAAFSNYGASIDLIAPGVAILSAQPGGGYGQLSGTSMAAPHVSAVAALIRARHPEYDRLQVAGALAQAASPVGPDGWDPATGHGALQVPPVVARGPVAVALQSPATGQPTAASNLPIVVTYDTPGDAVYRIDWGLNLAAPVWQTLETGTVGAGAGRLTATWGTSELATGSYVVRVQLSDGLGKPHEDRVVVERVGRAAGVEDLRVVRVLQGPQWHNVLEWRTDAAAAGDVQVLAGDRPLWRLPVMSSDTAHVLQLPPDLPPGDYDVQVRADTTGTAVSANLRVGPVGVLRWDLQQMSPQRPDGYLLPQITDFDADGVGELAAMIYGGGAYGVTSFFEQPVSAPAFTTTRLFIPWHSGDADVDGQADLLAVDARRVRLLEASAPATFPDRVAWEMQDVWGGEVADLDGDARPELVLRSATGSLFRVFESDGDDSFIETAALVNDTPGDNEMGDRQSVGDFDGDGRGEWISGDSDGDLMAFESVGDNAFRRVWVDTTDVAHTDGRLLSVAADLDGDGQDEFISGRLLSDPFDVEGRRWTLTVYGAALDGNGYRAEWQVQVLAGSASGNGVAVTDIDGDGQLEWVAALVPHLYVFRSDGDGGYEPVWHTSIRRTQRPAVGDLDGDGRNEFVYNEPAGGLLSVRWPVPETALPAPTSWMAVATGPDQVTLTWEAVPTASAYRLRRDGVDIARIVANAELGFAFVDTGRTQGESYVYELAATDSAGATGHFTQTISATPAPLPEVVMAVRTSATQVAVNFDQPMGPTAADPFRYQLIVADPAGLAPVVSEAQSVIFDRSHQRAVVTFPSLVHPTWDQSLYMSGVLAGTGAQLLNAQPLVLDGSSLPTTRVRDAVALASDRIIVRFDRPVRIDSGRVVVDAGLVQVLSIAVGDDAASLEVMLSPETPLRPLGRRYEVTIAGLSDDLGRPVQGRIFVTLQAQRLGQLVAFPNPVDFRRQSLSVAGLPVGTRVSVYTLAGELLWTGSEEDGDGGLQWNGLNERGARVAAGIYLLTANHDGRTRRVRIAILPRP